MLVHLLILALALPAAIASHNLLELENDDYEYKHHDNEEVRSILMDVHYKCRNITKVFSLRGHTVSGDKIYGITFGLHPSHHTPLIPEFKYLANIHGNEVVGKEMLLRLSDYLCSRYLEHNPDIVRLIQATRIHILPSVNPDGWYEASAASFKDRNDVIGRNNLNDVDLNRNFPDLTRHVLKHHNGGREELLENQRLYQLINQVRPNTQPETHALIDFIFSEPFVLSACLHGGDLVANYPYDESPIHPLKLYSETPDDNVFKLISMAYADAHPTMGKRRCYANEEGFINTHGITNGADWYSLSGGMQDFNYLATNCFEITLEISCQKYPDADTLPLFWQDQKVALLEYIWHTHLGIKGIISDAESGTPLSEAVIKLATYTGKNSEPIPIRHEITSAADGDYYRLLADGEYILTVSKHGYYPYIEHIIVSNANIKNIDGAQLINIELIPIK